MEGFSLNLDTRLSASADGIFFGNAEWGEQDNMLSLSHFEFEVSLLGLLKGVADIRMVARDAEVLVESSVSGESNWSMGGTDAEKNESPAEAAESDGTGALVLQPLLREIRLENIAIKMIQGENTVARGAVIDRVLIETPESNTAVSLSAEIERVPLELSGNLGNIGEVFSGVENPIRIEGQVDENTLAISGTWGPVFPELSMKLIVDVDVPSTSKLAELAGLSRAELGQLNLDFELAALDGHITLSKISTTLNGDLAAASIQGSLNDVLNMQGFDLDLTANIDFLNRFLKQLGIELPGILPPDIDVSANIIGQLDPLEIRDIHTEIHDDGLEIVISGSVGNALALQGIDGEFEIRTESTSTFSKYAGMDLPDLGTVQVSGRVQSAENLLRLDQVDARVSSSNINISATGGIDNLVDVVGIDFEVKGDISSFTEKNVSELENLFEQLQIVVPMEFLPESASFGAKGSGSLEQLEIMDIKGNVVDSGVGISLTASIDNAITFKGVEASVSLDSESTAVFSRYASVEIPELGPVNADAKVRSTESSYELEEMNARVGTDEFNLELSAGISDLLALRGINATLDSSIASLSNLSEIAKTTLPKTQPITLHADISAPPGDESSPATLSLDVDSGNTSVKLNGSLPTLDSVNNYRVSMQINTDSLQDFNQFVQKKLPDHGPFSLSGEFAVQPGAYSLDGFQLDLAEQSARGSVSVKVPETEDGLTSLEGELIIPYLDLTPYLLPGPVEDTGEASQEVVKLEGSGRKGDDAAGSAAEDDINVVATDRVFPTEPLPLDQLRLIDADFSIRADRLILGKMDMRNFKVALVMQDGILDIDPIQGQAGKGNINGIVNLDSSSGVVDLDLEIVADNLPMPNIGGELDLNVDLDGDGASIADIMGTLNGQLLVVIRDGEIAHSFVTNLGSGLFSFTGGKDTTELECAILRMDITDGKADFDDKLAVQMTDVNWRGGGEINFKTEKLGVGITPKPRAGIGISTGTLANLVYIGGTLKEPKILLNPKDIAVKYGKYMAYLSTGGLSLVAEALFNKTQANVDLCAQILDGTVFDVSADEIIKAQQEAEAADKSE